jgi:kinesin family member 6/9
LTNLLRDSLGGNCKTVMIANVHCEKRHIEETISTLKFATRMMRVKNEAVVNSVVDPTLQVKRLEKEIRDLKQELAMHDTLANRGRVNYDAYTPGQLSSIKETTVNFLEAGQYQEIENIDSLRMIREIFGVIRTEYQRQEQKIASIKR